jgi:hypothetical protein
MTIDIKSILGILSGVLAVASAIPYIYSSIKGSVRPSVVSQSLWLVLQIFQIYLISSNGFTWSLAVLIGTTVNVAMFLMLGLLGKGYTDISIYDIVCIAVFFVSLAIWLTLGNATTALIMSLVAEFSALIPTLRKTYLIPESESRVAWAILFAGSVLSIISSTNFSTLDIILPVYYLLQCSLVILFTYNVKRFTNKFYANRS